MEKPAFYCDFCGAPVPRNASRCPSCGRFFDAVKCPSCGFEGSAELFRKGCPSCGYAGASTVPAKTPLELPKKPSRRISPWVYRVAIAVLLAALLVIVVLLVRRF